MAKSLVVHGVGRPFHTYVYPPVPPEARSVNQTGWWESVDDGDDDGTPANGAEFTVTDTVVFAEAPTESLTQNRTR
jgi:hypothetical protein